MPSSNAHQLKLFSRNAFRILGLPASASLGAIQKADESLRRAIKLQTVKPSPLDLPWIESLERTEADARDALGRLTNDPTQRLRERIFWLEGSAQILSGLSASTVDAAIAHYAEVGGAAADHDAAILRCLAALICDPAINAEDRWATAFSTLLESVGSEMYSTLLLDSEREGGFEPSATAADIAQAKTDFSQLIADIFASVARDALAREDRGLCQRVLAVLRAIGLPNALVAKIESEAFGGREDNFLALCAEVRRQSGDNIRQDQKSIAHNRETCANASARFDAEISPELPKLEALLGSESDSLMRMREAAANCQLVLASDYTWADEFAVAERLLRNALNIVPGDSASMPRIHQYHGIVSRTAQRQASDSAELIANKFNNRFFAVCGVIALVFVGVSLANDSGWFMGLVGAFFTVMALGWALVILRKILSAIGQGPRACKIGWHSWDDVPLHTHHGIGRRTTTYLAVNGTKIEVCETCRVCTPPEGTNVLQDYRNGAIQVTGGGLFSGPTLKRVQFPSE